MGEFIKRQLRRAVVLWMLAASSWGLCQSIRNPLLSQPVRSAKGVTSDERDQAAELNRKGAASVQGKLLDQARAQFRKAIELDPSLADAYENLALLLMLEGDDAAAEATARHLLLIAPDNYNARLVGGVAAVNQRQFQRGLNTLAPLSALPAPGTTPGNATDPIVSAAQAVALQQTGRAAAASRMNLRLQGAKLEDQDVVLAGQLFREPHLRAQAQQWLEAIAQRINDVSPEALSMLAQIYVQQHKATEASALLERILASDPGNIDALVELSDLELASGNHDASLAYLNKAKETETTNVRFLSHLGRAYIKRHMHAYASQVLQRVVALDPYDREDWYWLGLAQFTLDDNDAAEKDFRAALQLDPKDQWSRVALGAVLETTSRTAESRVQFKAVLGSFPHNGAAYYYLGKDELRSNDLPAARRDLTKAVAYAKDDPRPWAALAELQMDTDDLASARMSLDRALALNPTSATAHYQRASLFRLEKKTAETKQELELFRKYQQLEKEQRVVGIAVASE
jgi:tetratricopeptide (TPR) repeat protein